MENEKVKKENMSVAAQWKRENVKDEEMLWAYTEQTAVDSCIASMERQGIQDPIEVYIHERNTNSSRWTLLGKFEKHNFEFSGAIDNNFLDDWTLKYIGSGRNVAKLMKILRRAMVYAQKKAEEFRAKHLGETKEAREVN